ncbi:MAG TPA: hypothetical protein VLI05_05030 [Candidatus Saccharimonadia bacterium]|nr:hypothetical protein [Candidatus Saccharimonadia bacterium]
MRKVIAALIALALAVIGLTACGGQETPPQDTLLPHSLSINVYSQLSDHEIVADDLVVRLQISSKLDGAAGLLDGCHPQYLSVAVHGDLPQASQDRLEHSKYNGFRWSEPQVRLMGFTPNIPGCADGYLDADFIMPPGTYDVSWGVKNNGVHWQSVGQLMVRVDTHGTPSAAPTSTTSGR